MRSLAGHSLSHRQAEDFMPRLLFGATLARFAVWCGAFLAAIAGASFATAEGKLDYGRDIRPILADNCFRCHGPDAKQRQADLRLDVRDEAVKKLESGMAAVVPSDVEHSGLIARIMSADESERMPP